MRVGEKIRRDETGELEQAYTTALMKYFSQGGEDALQSAYEIGRAALACGWSILDMAGMHHASIARVMERTSSQVSFAQEMDKARQFFSESLSPYEMALRGYRDATLAMRRLNETLEQEIQRIAHAVHDEAGQLLFAARLTMDGVAQELDRSNGERLREVGSILDQVEKQLRKLSHELRPTILDDLGLLAALQFLAGNISKRAGLSIRVHSTLKERFATPIETAVYRVVQEALTNITKHASAKNVKIRLRKVGTSLHCLIQDDGVGFDAPSALSSTTRSGLGLVGMRERLNAVGGTLQINSEAGRGTEVQVKISLK
jgi:signal transduction histidine kinase